MQKRICLLDQTSNKTEEQVYADYSLFNFTLSHGDHLRVSRRLSEKKLLESENEFDALAVNVGSIPQGQIFYKEQPAYNIQMRAIFKCSKILL